MAIKRISFKTAGEMQQAALEMFSGGATVLTANPRLNQRLVHLLRMRKIKNKSAAWETPPVYSFRFFIDKSHEELWREKRQLSYEAALFLWTDILSRRGSSEEIQAGPDLASEYQRTYDFLQCHEIGRASSGEDSLITGRNEIFSEFCGEVSARGFVTYAEAINEMKKAVESSEVILPGKLTIISGDDYYPVELKFLKFLEQYVEMTELSFSSDLPLSGEVELFDKFEDEVEVTIDRALYDLETGKRSVAIIYTEEKYREKLERVLNDIAPLDGAAPLSETALFGLMDVVLRLNEGLLDEKLFSIVAFPAFRGHNSLDIAKWGELATTIRRERKKGLASFIEAFDLGKELKPFIEPRPQKVRLWIKNMKEFLGLFDFGNARKETFAGMMWEKLHDSFRFLEAESGEDVVELGRFREMLAVTCANAKIGIKSSLKAGIEVIPLSEAWGLSFDKAFIMGCRQGLLPAPPAKYPFLHPEEKKQTGFLSVKENYIRSERFFRSVLSGAEEVVLSRPLFEGDTPVLPSPFIGDGKKNEEWNIYFSKKKGLLKAKWLISAIDAPPKKEKEAGLIEESFLPQEMSVSEATDLFGCPFKFFMKRIVGVEQPGEAGTLLNPLEWGRAVHKILAQCAPLIKSSAGRLPAEALREKLAEEAEKNVGRLLFGKPLKDSLSQFLLGREGKEGVLDKLAVLETERAAAGWNLEGAEEWLSGIRVPGFEFSLKGKLDRLDVNSGKNEAMVIDYKSGGAATDANKCQVSLYKKMAEEKKEGPFSGKTLSGAVLPLREDELRLWTITPDKEEEAPARIKNGWDKMKRGAIEAEPHNDDECKNCPYSSLCHIDEKEEGRGIEDD